MIRSRIRRLARLSLWALLGLSLGACGSQTRTVTQPVTQTATAPATSGNSLGAHPSALSLAVPKAVDRHLGSRFSVPSADCFGEGAPNQFDCSVMNGANIYLYQVTVSGRAFRGVLVQNASDTNGNPPTRITGSY
jgi:hypothetical protein